MMPSFGTFTPDASTPSHLVSRESVINSLSCDLRRDATARGSGETCTMGASWDFFFELALNWLPRGGLRALGPDAVFSFFTRVRAAQMPRVGLRGLGFWERGQVSFFLKSRARPRAHRLLFFLSSKFQYSRGNVGNTIRIFPPTPPPEVIPRTGGALRLSPTVRRKSDVELLLSAGYDGRCGARRYGTTREPHLDAVR